jgi:acetoacetyl-CoA synthetase
VLAGLMQCPALGIDVQAYDAQNRPVIGEVGELVLTKPAPCMPLGFWGDADGRRYFDAYFAEIPGVWRHGDFIRINADLSIIIVGRSDSTLNRHGVRIGTSEIYRCVEQVPGVIDSLVVALERSSGHYYMPLFVQLAPGIELDTVLDKVIRDRLRAVCSPRHVPDEIHAVSAIPYTLSGKRWRYRFCASCRACRSRRSRAETQCAIRTRSMRSSNSGGAKSSPSRFPIATHLCQNGLSVVWR